MVPHFIAHTNLAFYAKMLINAGVKRVVFQGEYPDGLALELMNEAGIDMITWAQGEE